MTEQVTAYEKNDYVVHWSGKVCRVEDVSVLKMTEKEELYYTLSPLREERARIYVPVRKGGESLRPVMSKEEAICLIKELPDIEPLAIQDERMRDKEYKSAFHTGDNRQRIKIVKELYQRKRRRLNAGKKPASSDLETMSFVERSFEEEMAVALGIKNDEVRNVIADTLKLKEEYGSQE